jgi:hypothetical protein
MPEVSRFYGIVITLNYDEHLPPHFHARYADDRAAFHLTGELLAGSMSNRASVWFEIGRGSTNENWRQIGR